MLSVSSVKTEYQVDINKAIDDYSDMVYRIAITRVQKKEIAEDIYQEVFLRLNQNIDKIQGEEHLKNWLIRVTINCTKDELMSKWSNMEELSDSYEAAYGISSARDNSSEYDVFSEVQKLDKKYRTVIYLFYYEDMKITDIARLLGSNESTIKTWLSRAKNELRKSIKPDDFDTNKETEGVK